MGLLNTTITHKENNEKEKCRVKHGTIIFNDIPMLVLSIVMIVSGKINFLPFPFRLVPPWMLKSITMIAEEEKTKLDIDSWIQMYFHAWRC